jgi:hypothetical protein
MCTKYKIISKATYSRKNRRGFRVVTPYDAGYRSEQSSIK